MREGEQQLQGKCQYPATDRSPGVMTDCQRGPEDRVGEPHFGRKAEDQGAEQGGRTTGRSEEHTSELQSHVNLVCRLLLEKKKKQTNKNKPQTHINRHHVCNIKVPS